MMNYKHDVRVKSDYIGYNIYFDNQVGKMIEINNCT